MNQFYFKVHQLATGQLLTSGTPYTGEYIPAARARTSSLLMYITGVNQGVNVRLQAQNPFNDTAPATIFSGNYLAGTYLLPISGGPFPNMRIVTTGQNQSISAVLYQQN